MGYNTNFTLEWKAQDGYVGKPHCSHEPPAKSKFCPECGGPAGNIGPDTAVELYIAQKDYLKFALGSDGESGDACKWYDWFDDMKEMSAAIPNVLFTLHGEGEENSDIWDAYFLNGKGQHHRAVLTIAPYDPNGWGEYKDH